MPFWYRLTWVVPEKGPLNGCVCVCVCGWYGRYCSVRPAPEMAAIMALSAAAVAHPTAQLMDVVAEAAHIFTVLLAAIVANTQNAYV